MPVMEDCLDSGMGLARVWDAALVSPRFTVAQVASGVESRLLPILGGLAQGDAAVVQQLLLPAVDGDDAHLAFVAALGFLEGRTASIDDLLERLGNPKAIHPILRALGLTGNPATEGALRDLVAKNEGGTLAALLEVLAFRCAEPGVALDTLLESSEPSVLAATLRVARSAGMESTSTVRALAEGLLRVKHASVRGAAIEVGLACGSRLAWAVAQESVETGDVDDGMSLAALAASGDPSDVLRLVKLASNEAHRPAALFALGFTGSPLALEVCLAAMDEGRSARLAGEAFSIITGLKLEGEYARTIEKSRQEPIPLEEEDLDADLVPGPESELPVPDAAKVRQWWAANKSRFQPDLRYLGGQPLDALSLLEGFRIGPMRRRRALGVELAIRTRGEWRVETRQWAKVQLSKQAEQVKAPIMLPFGRFLGE